MKVCRLFLLNVVVWSISSSVYPTSLSYDSKKSVVVSAVKGALGATALYVGGSAVVNNNFRIPCLGGHIKGYSIAAALGALAMGAWSYNHLPESYYDDAYAQLERISHNNLILLVISLRGAEFIEQVKQFYVRDSFPLVSAFKHMNYLYSCLEAVDTSLDYVLNSSCVDLYAACYEMQIIVQTIQSALEIGLQLVKDEPQFINEYNAQTSLAMQQAQALIAQAAYSQASAAWVQAMKK